MNKHGFMANAVLSLAMCMYGAPLMTWLYVT